MEPKIHAGEDKAVTVTRAVWYQHLCRRKQREAKNISLSIPSMRKTEQSQEVFFESTVLPNPIAEEYKGPWSALKGMEQ